MTQLLEAWQDSQRGALHREIVAFNHRLRECGLFEDDALERLLDSHPREDMTICTMRPDPPPDERWVSGEAHGVNGADLLEAVRRGALWISPRRVMTQNPIYASVFQKAMKEFGEQTRQTILGSDGSMLISGPRMGIFMHIDVVDTMLWHVRGEKTLYVYPPREDFISEAALEAILLKETLSDLPYRPEMEDQTKSFDLTSGEAVAWPLHSPHRVVNGDSLNVSVSIEYTTARSVMTTAPFYVNGRMRRTLGWAPRTRDLPGFVKPAYAVAAKALKIVAPLTDTVERNHARLFDVDLSQPACVRWREGATGHAALHS